MSWGFGAARRLSTPRISPAKIVCSTNRAAYQNDMFSQLCHEKLDLVLDCELGILVGY